MQVLWHELPPSYLLMLAASLLQTNDSKGKTEELTQISSNLLLQNLLAWSCWLTIAVTNLRDQPDIPYVLNGMACMHQMELLPTTKPTFQTKSCGFITGMQRVFPLATSPSHQTKTTVLAGRRCFYQLRGPTTILCTPGRHVPKRWSIR